MSKLSLFSCLDKQAVLYFVYAWRTLPTFLDSHSVLGALFYSEDSLFIKL